MALASRSRPRPPLGALPTKGFVISRFGELYDYEELRSLKEPTAILAHVDERTLVLGSSQPDEILRDRVEADFVVRRRRGGGGVVLLQPDDVWIDFWIPPGDQRWQSDVNEMAVAVGTWWRDILSMALGRQCTIMTSLDRSNEDLLVACFAVSGPGELTLDQRKVVGITQWRVREGAFVSTLLPARSTEILVSALRAVPAHLVEALAHHSITSLGITDSSDLLTDLLALSGPWSERSITISR